MACLEGKVYRKLTNCIVEACTETDDLAVGLAGGAAGAKSGLIAGGAIGTMLGGIGAGPGALVGSIIGGVGAGHAAQMAYEGTGADKKYDDEICNKNLRNSTASKLAMIQNLVSQGLTKDFVVSQLKDRAKLIGKYFSWFKKILQH